MRPPFASLLLGIVLVALSGTATADGPPRPDALLLVDQHRDAIIERVVTTWPETLTAEQSDVLRRTLARLRADRLMTISISPGVRTLVAMLEGADRLESAGIAARGAPKALGSPTSDLTYTPITPCRIVDTRFGGGGSLGAGETRDWLAANPTGSFSTQGGSSTDCGIPTKPAAVLANFTVANTQSAYEFLSAWPFGQPRPTSSVLNWVAQGAQVGNGVIVPLCWSAVGCPIDFSVYVSGGAHVIIDVMGYFKAPEAMNVIWVGKSGAPFASIQAAIDFVAPLSSAATPYLIRVAPGTYFERIVLPDHVQLEGSGRDNTIISSSAAAGTVYAKASHGTELRSLSIRSDNAAQGPLALYVEVATSVRLIDVSVSGDSTSESWTTTAVDASQGALELVMSRISASSPGSCTGIKAYQLTMRDTRVSVSCGGMSATALLASVGVSNIVGSELSATGGQVDTVALLAGSAAVHVDRSAFAATAGPAGWAVAVQSAENQFADVRIRGSLLDANGGLMNHAIRRGASSVVRVAQSELRAPTMGAPICFGNYDANFGPIGLCQ